ncbi:TPA: hypothetical protein VCJ25_001245 [Streptococcus pyogenes]|nr:hypothetical protein [Streptococcus pyogenes]
MEKVFSSAVIFLSVLMLTGCSSEVSKVVKTDGVKEVQKNDSVKYTYSKDNLNIIVQLEGASNSEQAAIMQEMLSKGYSLQAIDTTFSESMNYNQGSTIINMYFQKK